MTAPTTAVIVSTYEAPAYLALVLEGLARQSLPPNEIFIADDGSGPETRELVEAWEGRMSSPLRHVWHPDQGFRKMRICNLAVHESTAERLIFLDGDSIPHRDWVADHARAHHRAPVLCGRRVKLGPGLTARVDASMVASGRLERLFGPLLSSALHGDTKRWGLGIRLPSLVVRVLHPRSRKLMGVNFSVSRSAFFHVNGYANDAPVRREDRELELRLRRSGFQLAPLLNRAIVYHLHHAMKAASPEEENRLRRLEAEVSLQSADGLEQIVADRAR